jgi:hypothetical protein
MQVPQIDANQTIIRLEMPYEFFRFVLYCMATYDNPTDPDMKETYEKCWEFVESLGAESPHQFIAENRNFMNRWRELLETGSNDIKNLLERVNFPVQP